MDSLRCYSDNWLYPMDLSVLFPAERPLEVDVGCGKGAFFTGACLCASGMFISGHRPNAAPNPKN